MVPGMSLRMAIVLDSRMRLAENLEVVSSVDVLSEPREVETPAGEPKQ
jgi:hypothetical protein